MCQGHTRGSPGDVSRRRRPPATARSWRRTHDTGTQRRRTPAACPRGRRAATGRRAAPRCARRQRPRRSLTSRISGSRSSTDSRTACMSSSSGSMPSRTCRSCAIGWMGFPAARRAWPRPGRARRTTLASSEVRRPAASAIAERSSTRALDESGGKQQRVHPLMLPDDASPQTSRGALLSSTAMRILFVCMGNICRSPTAEGVIAAAARGGARGGRRARLGRHRGWHAGEPPDARAEVAAHRRGVVLEGAARQMHRRRLRRLRPARRDGPGRTSATCWRSRLPRRARRRCGCCGVRFPRPRTRAIWNVPKDPYYGGERGFERVLELVAAACRGLLADVRAGSES